MKNYKNIIIIILFFYLLFSTCISKKPILKFKNGTFKIIQFTDLHFGENINKDLNTVKGQETILDIEKPDYVILSGDMISGYGSRFQDQSHYKIVWDQLTEPMRKRNIPWSVTFGNHDGDGILGNFNLIDLDMSYNLSLTKKSPINVTGQANYVLEIESSNSTNLNSLIYVFDSDIRPCNDDSGPWGCIDTTQVDWYRNQSNYYKLPAISFVHVPPIEVLDLWNNHNVYGEFGDSGSCCYYTDESKFVEAMIEQKDIQGLYFGHDHGNDYHGDYFGIDLGYGRKSGFGSYPPKNPIGARVFEIQETPYLIDTWIRNVNGEREDQLLHKQNNQEKVPRFCCTTNDSRDYKNWGIYLGLCISILVLSFILQLKFNQRRNDSPYYVQSSVYEF